MRVERYLLLAGWGREQRGFTVDIIMDALYGIKRHPLRSFLSTLGIAFALAAFVGVLAVEQSWQRAIIQQYNDIGADRIDIHLPSRESEYKELKRQVFLPDDASAIQQCCSEVQAVGLVIVSGQATLRSGRSNADGFTLRLINSDYLKIMRWQTWANPNLAMLSPAGCWISPLAAKSLLGSAYRAHLPKEIRINGHLIPLNGIAEVPAISDDSACGYVFLPWQTRGLASNEGVIMVAKAANVRQAAQQIDKLLNERLGAKRPINFAQGPWYIAARVIAARFTLRLFTAITLICVLIVAVLGIANNLLVNLEERIREIALRRALGAQARRIMTEVLMESSLICLAGGILSMVLAFYGLQVLGAWLFGSAQLSNSNSAVAVGMKVPAQFEPYISWQVVAVGAIVCLASALAAGWVPASIAASVNPAQALVLAAPRRRTVGQLLATVQVIVGVCAALILLSLYSGLARQSLDDLKHIVRIDTIATQHLTIAKQFPTQGEAIAMQQSMLSMFQKVCASPQAMALLQERCCGVASVVRIWQPNINPAPVKRGRVVLSAGILGIDAGLANEYRSEEVSLLQGRAITAADSREKRRVCVIDDAVSRELFGSENPLGQQIRIVDTAYTVVGVSIPIQNDVPPTAGETSDTNLDNVILPISACPNSLQGGYNLIFKLADPARSKAAEDVIQAAFRSVGSIPADYKLQLGNMAELYERYQKLGTDLAIRATLIGSVGLWVALVGLVNVIFASSQARTREIGILRALGAKRSNILTSIATEGVVISLVGCIPGVILAFLLTRMLSRIANVPVWIPPDWLTLVVICMIVVSFLAALLPASQAASVEPSVALRSE